MGLTEQQVQVAQGALFLIDNIGSPPPNADFRLFMNNAIADHLKRHTYYYQQRNLPGRVNRRRVTSNWMREWFKTLLGKVSGSLHQSELQGENAAEKLLRRRTTQGFSAEVLSKYGYDKATFSEADLPGYSRHPGVAEDAEATEEDEITGTKKAFPRKLMRGSSGHFTSPWKMPTGASRAASPSKNLQKSSRSSDDMESEKADDEDDRHSPYSDTNDDFGVRDNQAELYLQAQAPPNQSTRANHATAQAVTSEAEKFAPRLESPEEHGGGLPKQQTSHLAATSTTATESIPPSFPSAAQDNNTPHLPSRALNALDNVLSRIKKRNGSNPEQDGLKQPSARSPVDSGKRKREEEDLGVSLDDEITLKPTERKKSKTSIKLSRHVGHPQVVIPSATSPPKASSELTFGASTPLAADATHGVEDPRGMQPEVDEVKDSQSPQRTASSQDVEQHPQPAPLDAEKQGRSFEKFYQKIEVATDRVIASIGKIGNSVSFLDESPSERLESLYRRCWGSDWDALRVRLTEDYVFTTPEVAMSVISAFLFENVLNQQASIHDIRAKQLELKGTMGRAILRALNLENGEHDLAEIARTIESEDARVKLAASEKSGSLQQELRAEAEQFTKELWDIMVPHFRSLSRLARGFGLSSHRPEQDWRAVFEQYFTQLIEEILHYRLNLLASGCEHMYTWPDAAGEYDLREMDIHGAQMKLPLQVMFTVFPGVKVKPPGAANMRAYKGMKAMVKVEKPRGA